MQNGKKNKTKQAKWSAMNNTISSPECPWPPSTPTGVKAPPPSTHHLLLSSPPLPFSPPPGHAKRAGGRGFTTQGRLFSSSGTHCRAACPRSIQQVRRWRKGGRLRGGSASSEATQVPSPHNKENATLAKLRVNVNWCNYCSASLIRGSICWGAVEFPVVVLV